GPGLGDPAVPRRPWSLASIPQPAKQVDIAHGVGALPEAAVAIHAQLTLLGQRLERLALEHAAGIRGEVAQDGPVEDEESAGDQRVAEWLLGEPADLPAVVDELAEARGRAYAGYRGEAAV